MSRLTGAPPRPFYKFENRFRRCASATLGSIGIPLVVASLSFEAALVCCAAWLGCWCTLQLVEQVAPGFFNQSDIASFDWINQECLKPFVNYNRYNFHSNVLWVVFTHHTFWQSCNPKFPNYFRMLPLLLLSVGSSLGAIPECGKTTLTSLPEGDPQVFLSGQDNCKLTCPFKTTTKQTTNYEKEETKTKQKQNNTDFPARGRPSGIVVWTLLRTEQHLAKCSLRGSCDAQ